MSPRLTGSLSVCVCVVMLGHSRLAAQQCLYVQMNKAQATNINAELKSAIRLQVNLIHVRFLN